MVSVRSAVYDLRQCRYRLEKILAGHQADGQLSLETVESDLIALVAFMRYLEVTYGDQADYEDRKGQWSTSEEDLEPSEPSGDHSPDWGSRSSSSVFPD